MDENLSAEQRQYFRNSKVRDDKGNLLKVYHGTGTKITSFDPAYTSQGNDQYGSGFYFTTERKFAEAYTTLRNTGRNGQEREKLGGEDYPNVVEAYVNIENPIYINNGIEEGDLSNVLIPNEIVYDIVKVLPSLYHGTNDDIEPNPLGDWVEDFWEANPQTDEEFQPLIKKMVEEYFQKTDLRDLDILFGKYGTELRKAVNKVMGYDGVIINFEDNQHIVAWFPEQIKDVKNLKPKNSPYLMDKQEISKRSESSHRQEKILINSQVKEKMEVKKEITRNYDRLKGTNNVIAFDQDHVLE